MSENCGKVSESARTQCKESQANSSNKYQNYQLVQKF